MSEPLHLPPDQGPETEQVRLGDDVYEMDPATARGVTNYLQGLAAQYGASLEEFRRQAMATVGTPQPMPQAPIGLPEAPDFVPDPDIMFRDKAAWSHQFQGSLQDQFNQLRSENAQTAQAVVNTVQQELARRDAVAQAKAIHDKAMEEMLDRRGLADNTRIVQAIYNEQFEKMRHLPLEIGLDKIGQLAQEEIARIRAGETWTMGPANTQTGVTARPPARHLRTAQRAARPVAAAPAAEEGLTNPAGDLGPLGRMIRTRQAKILGGSA